MATVMKTSREVRGVGLRIPRADAPEKVAGKTQYVADLVLPGMLQARLLRSPHAHARIKSIDVSKALARPDRGRVRRAGGGGRPDQVDEPGRAESG